MPALESAAGLCRRRTGGAGANRRGVAGGHRTRLGTRPGNLPGVTWSWRYQDAEGKDVPPPADAETFSAKGDAESWLGESWRDLLDSGVTQVVLVEDERVEYEMPLTPAEG